MTSQLRRQASAGFTLIEVLLVIVIILMLAGAMVVYVLPQQEGAAKSTTKLLLQDIEKGLQMYKFNIGSYPSEEQGGLEALLKKPTFENESLGDKWQGPYLKAGTKFEDSWNHKLVYEVVDTSLEADKTTPPYRLLSVGPDGQRDTDDDVKLVQETDGGSGVAPNAQ